MAGIEATSSFIATAVKDTVHIFSKSSQTCMIYKHVFSKEAANDKVIDYIAFSPLSNYFLALFSDKTLVVWQLIKQENCWKKFFSIAIHRRSTSAAFSPDEHEIYVADKSGDLYKIGLASIDSDVEDKEKLQLILGHVSILLDVTATEKFIVTADRDEKIRVSLREKPFVIHSYCLGHTEYVCKVIHVEKNYLISSSGDGSVCLWDLDLGLLLCKCVVNDNVVPDNKTENSNTLKQSPPVMLSYNPNLGLLAVGNVGLNDNTIALYKVSCSQSNLNKCYEIMLPHGHHLVDLSFDVSENESSTLYALLQSDENITVCSFSCDLTSYSTTQCCIAEFINSTLATESVSDVRPLHYLHLYKTTVPGHTYDTFYKKKNNQFKKGKKIKIQEQTV